MLKLSEKAAAALENIRQSQGIPEAHSTRLTADHQSTGDLALRLEFVEQIPEDDQVAERAGTEVYIDPEIAEPLGDTVMDVQDGDQGLAFVFRSQTP